MWLLGFNDMQPGRILGRGAISYVQVAEGALNEVASMLIRMRELTSQAASDTIGNRERNFLDQEFQQIRQEAAKVTWPSRKETSISTVMVFVFVFISALFFMLVDWLLQMGVRGILGLGG